MSISCDVCKFSSPHDYVSNHYYCNKGLFFNDREPRSNCENGEINELKYKYKYGISYAMSQFKETVSKIIELRNREKIMVCNFEKSVDELSEVFRYILDAELEGVKQIYLTVNTCPELYAKKLKCIGFEIEETRNDSNILCGYYIRWKSTTHD